MVFALLKEREELWYLPISRDAYDALGVVGYSISYTLIGLVCGFTMSVLAVSMSIMLLVIYLRRKYPEKDTVS